MLVNKNNPGAGVDGQVKHQFLSSLGNSWHVAHEALQSNLHIVLAGGFITKNIKA